MKYFCIEENRISAVLDYEPNVPDTVEVVQVSDEAYKSIQDRTHYFDPIKKVIKPVSDEAKAAAIAEKEKNDAIDFLNNSDWKVLRHIREKALNIETTLTEEEYLALETQRAEAASKI